MTGINARRPRKPSPRRPRSLTHHNDFFFFFSWGIWHSKNVVYFFGMGEGGLRKCMVCTLVKMLTFMDNPL